MLAPDELHRYARHISLPEVGEDGQETLRAASVLIVGAGGLGSPSSLYLAAAGVGRIGLVDFDRVDLSNLQRQVLYDTPSVGMPKLEAATRRLNALNPRVTIVPHPVRLTAENALGILGQYDVIVDGSDNFPTRYLVNDACVFLGRPNVYGSVFRFDGQASVFAAKSGPCYRCMYPQPPEPGLVPSCEEGGVLGVVPGIVGMIQATETIKLILGKGDSLIGRVLMINLLRMSFRELRVPKNPACVVCGDSPTVRELIDYEAFCGLSRAKENESSMTPEELVAKMSGSNPPRLVDVREPMEWQQGHIDGAELVPLRDLAGRLDEFDPGEEIVCYCLSGARSANAASIFHNAGFAKVFNLAGGIRRWVGDGKGVVRG